MSPTKCGKCAGCRHKEKGLPPCDECRFCLDSPRCGGKNILRQACVKKKCVHTRIRKSPYVTKNDKQKIVGNKGGNNGETTKLRARKTTGSHLKVGNDMTSRLGEGNKGNVHPWARRIVGGARPLEIKEEPKENLSWGKLPGGVKRSQTLVGSKLEERTNSKRRSSRLTSLRSESESRSTGKKRISLRVANLVQKEHQIVDQEDSIEEAATEDVAEEETEHGEVADNNHVAVEAVGEVAVRQMEMPNFEVAEPAALHEDIHVDQPLNNDVASKNPLAANASIDCEIMEDVEEDRRPGVLAFNNALASLVERKKLKLDRMKQEEFVKKEILQGLEAECLDDQKRRDYLNNAKKELLKRDEELKRQRDELVTHLRAFDEENSEVVKRQEERVAKISNIKAELRDREAFRLEEESKLEEGQGHLQALLKTWPWARGALELAFATPMRKRVEGDQRDFVCLTQSRLRCQFISGVISMGTWRHVIFRAH